MQRRPLPASAILALLGIAPVAAAQNPSELTFSVDWQGPLMGVTTPAGFPINEADLLVQSNPFFAPAPPEILRRGVFLQQYSSCVGHGPGVSCGVEIDAISFGRDARLRDLAAYDFMLLFSVDEHAVGAPVPTPPPNVATEAAFGDAGGDVFLRRYTGIGPFGPIAGFNVGVVDGDGRRFQGSALFPGLGLTEPSPPTNGVPEMGDNLDALDVRPMGTTTAPLFFSLEQGLIDPRETSVTVTNSAMLQPNPVGGNFTGADILVADANNNVQAYADPGQLGLSPMGLDDIDALAVVENGVAGFQPSLQLYDWLPGGAGTPRDMVLFSVRRGSAIIGQIDSLQGIPITEADILVPPIGGGMLGTTPGILATAESLGLDVNRGAFFDTGDDLNALDVVDDSEEPIKDCQPNGTWDALDISGGGSMDVNTNGIPDECEDEGDAFCHCDMSSQAPCGNNAAAPGVGCLNNRGLGGKLEASGQSSVATDSLVFSASQLTLNTFSIVFMGDGVGSAFPPNSNGRLCVGGGAQGTFRLAIRATGSTGSFTYGPGLIGAAAGLATPATIAAGSTWAFQAWYRDNHPAGATCSGASNLTNGWRTTFTP